MMTGKRLLPFFSALITLLLCSCEFQDPNPVPVPAYISVPSFTFLTNTNPNLPNQGSNSCKYPDVWLYATGNDLGCIGFPALIPIQGSGITTIGVDAGILESGQIDHRVAYPLMARYTQKVNLIPGHVDTIKPVFKYLDNAVFRFIEDYDSSSGFNFIINPLYAGVGDTILRINDDRAQTLGNYSGMVSSPTNSNTFQMYTSDPNGIGDLPGQGSPVYLEMDYNSNMNLQVGFYYYEPNQPTSSATPLITLYPTSEWKKVYLNLSQELGNKAAGTRYRFYIGYFKDSGTQAKVYFDNIKLVHLK